MTNKIYTSIISYLNRLFYMLDSIMFIVVFFTELTLIFIYVSSPSIKIPLPFLSFINIAYIASLIQILRIICYNVVSTSHSSIIYEFFMALIFICLSIIIGIIYNISCDELIIIKNQFLLVSLSVFFVTYIIILQHRVQSFLSSINLDFSKSFAVGFIFLIFMGTYILSLPISSTHYISLVDLFFVATSAVTVTGLSTINIAYDLTFFGQFILMILIQLGGLGIITFSIFFLLNTGEKISYEQRTAQLHLFNQKSFSNLNRLLRTIFISTFVIEGLGSICIYITTIPLGLNFSDHIFFSIFHAISAFCNAGFSTLPNGLASLIHNSSFLYTISALILLGGMGFFVISEIFSKLKYQLSNKKKYGKVKFSIVSKIILSVNLILVVFGAVFFYILEKDTSLINLSLSEQISNSIFNSITTRTAGFNTVDIASLSIPTNFMNMILMFIGASPGSTGGGIKVTTFFLVVWLWVSVLRKNRKNPSIRNISIPPSLIAGASSVVYSRMFVIVTVLFIFLFTQTGSFFNLLFEVVSAFSTVGLSIGALSEFDNIGKIIMMITMFIGRIGVLYVFSTLLPVSKQKNHNYRLYSQLNMPLE